MITKEELLNGRDETFKDEYTDEISKNLDQLLEILNVLRSEYGKPMRVTSGWRPSSINNMVKGAAPKSNHTIGLAADIYDPNGEFMAWVLKHLELMQSLGVFFEDFRWTPTWVHVQIIKPKSGKRIYVPNSSLPAAPDRWTGRYDSRFDEKASK